MTEPNEAAPACRLVTPLGRDMSPEECLRRAEECRRQATNADSHATEMTLLNMARTWTALANQTARLRAGQHPSLFTQATMQQQPIQQQQTKAESRDK